jgi:hypothetical protein
MATLDNYQEYAMLSAQIKELDAKRKQLSINILSDMENQGMEKYGTKFGTFSIRYRKKYKYSDDVKKAEDHYKMLKNREEKMGTATFEVSKFITLR